MVIATKSWEIALYTCGGEHLCSYSSWICGNTKPNAVASLLFQNKPWVATCSITPFVGWGYIS